MSIFKLFKRKKVTGKKEKVKKEEIKKEGPEIKDRKVKKLRKKRVQKKVSASAYRILISPHTTEKATDLSVKNQYVFRVFPRANKTEIKKAVEEIYGVDVLKVRVINIPQKPKRWGRAQGWKKGYKKAIVKIEEGQKIEVTPR